MKILINILKYTLMLPLWILITICVLLTGLIFTTFIADEYVFLIKEVLVEIWRPKI